MLEVGTVAPDFELPDQDSVMHKLSDWRGSKVVLYFYAKDNTSGCTSQAQGFAELNDEFVKQGAVVVGISKDTVASHKKFQEKYGLPFVLLADPDLEVLKAYEVWQEKKLYGKVSMGTVRTTYIVDKDGVIISAHTKVNAAQNPGQTLDELKAGE